MIRWRPQRGRRANEGSVHFSVKRDLRKSSVANFARGCGRGRPRSSNPVAFSARSFDMYFKQFYLGCLAHASYLIGSEGEAAVVDPQRDVDQYIEEAAAHGLKIKYIIETHLHADFISGHREL